MRFQNKVALVTGASRGIGRAIAERLAAEGAAVVVNYVQGEAAAREVVESIVAAGGRATALQADVSDLKAAQELVKATTAAYGRLDILVNNAGITRDQLFLRMTESDWDEVLRVNLKSVFNCCKAASRVMLRQRSGRIVNIASIAGVAGNIGQANYAATKAGMIGFTKTLARELAAINVTVNAVAPGFITTQMTEDLTPEVKEATLKMIPQGRWGTPEEVAAAVAFLASDDATYITGQTLHVDGGTVM